ncbi:hypothetical protein VTO42DRAFT_7733 [Malbranchea cinnamomea]
MSDPPGRTPDHGPSASVNADRDADASGNGSFLVHSKKTLTQDLPPKVDNKVLSRQKRRRTSPEDYAILEAEYQRNPKPDKATRASIVSRVSLGDKEVQIWFQNRRQNDRRRSRPLPPHNPPPSASGIITARISDERSTANTQNDNNSSQSVSNSAPSLNTSFSSSVSSDPSNAATSSQVDELQSASDKDKSQEGVGLNKNTIVLQPVAEALPPSAGKRKRSDSDMHAAFRSERRQATGTSGSSVPPSLRISLSFDGEAILRKEDEKTPSPPKLRDPVRISFSADGEAVVRTASEPSPCKNRASILSARQARFGTLRRCHSVNSLGTTSGVSSLRERLFGRSRDSRAWELCDTDARSALSSTQGESRCGSITAKSKLGHVKSSTPQAARNTFMTPQGPPSVKRTKLSRTVSLSGRLESDSQLLVATKDGPKSFKEYYDGDSDKENWIPGTRISSVHQRRSTDRQRIAQGLTQRPGTENMQVLGKSRRPNGVRPSLPTGSKHASALSQDENSGAALNLIRGTNGNTSQVEEDFDCVQGLLSLSQGAWR